MGTKKKISLGDRASYFYIKNIKKWMFCPACKSGKMTFNKKKSLWTCEDCGYHFSEQYFLNDCVFWFCDECEAYLNNQEGFNKKSAKHICRNCGYENDTTFNNIKGICSDCGKVLPNPNATLCSDCRQARLEKAKEWLIKARKVVGVVAATVGEAALAASTAGDDDTTDYTPLYGGGDEGDDVVDKSWLKSASEDELRSKKAEISADTDWCSGSILDGDFDDEIEALDAIEDELNQRSRDLYNSEDHSNESYGVPREHGWYLPNDDD